MLVCGHFYWQADSAEEARLFETSDDVILSHLGLQIGCQIPFETSRASASAIETGHAPMLRAFTVCRFSRQRRCSIVVCCCLLFGCLIQVGCDNVESTTDNPPVVTNEGSQHRTGFDFQPDATDQSLREIPVETLLKHSPRFVDVARSVGLIHEYQNGAAGQLLMVEALGGGCGWLDYDGDRHPDLYLTQGGKPDAPVNSKRPPNRLFRNLGTGMFVEVTEFAMVGDRGYGQGVAIGDYDNDGFDDIYVTNVGRNVLYRNQGDGTFIDVSKFAGVDDLRWSSSAAWGDVDLDGDLDLYVCNYLNYDPYHPMECIKDGVPALCHPRDVEAWPDEFFENRGDGTFRAAARQWGLYGSGNKALGVVIADLNNDGRPDIYVCNDTTANFLFINQPDSRFAEIAVRLGAAFSASGHSQASMGVAIGDYDRSGDLDLFLTHFTGEANTLYRNLGQAGFQDVSGLIGLRSPTLPKLGFGTVMHDFNQDGREDLFVTNGHIDERNADGDGYKMLPQLFTFADSEWRECSEQAGPFFSNRLVGRGVASADYDSDGDLDLCVVHQNSPTALLRNDSERGHWLTVHLTGRKSNRSAIGSRVTVEAGELSLMQELAGGTSYCASHQHILVFGLGESDEPCTVRVRWPSGRTLLLDNVVPDQSLRLIEPTE